MMTGNDGFNRLWSNRLRSVFFRLPHILLGLVLLGAGCDISFRHEPDANIRRMAKNWPPYRAPTSSQGSESFDATANPETATASASGATGPNQLVSATAVAKQMGLHVNMIPIRANEDWDLSETAMDTLGRIGAPAVPALVVALENEDPTLRVQAAKILARIGPDARQSVAPLILALDDPDESVRKAAARALGQIGPAAQDAVLPLLDIIEQAPHHPNPSSPESVPFVQSTADPVAEPATDPATLSPHHTEPSPSTTRPPPIEPQRLPDSPTNPFKATRPTTSNDPGDKS